MLRAWFRLLPFLLLVWSMSPRTMPSTEFPVGPHPDATIEWWYANAHVKSHSGRRFALVCAFFRFGPDDGRSLLGMPPRPAAHYLIYSITDLDNKVTATYSGADPDMVKGLRDVLQVTGARDPRQVAMLDAARHGYVPPPHQLMIGHVQIGGSPFSVTYGTGNKFAALDGTGDKFTLDLVGAKEAVASYASPFGATQDSLVPNGQTSESSPDNHSAAISRGGASGDERSGAKECADAALIFSALKPVMAVGGRGQTGLIDPTDMYYFSRTRCRVQGWLSGLGIAGDVNGEGWIDHQWGTSWVLQNNGWDWWGIQLSNGLDLLIFRQRDLATGRIFFPEATIMDKHGRQTVTHNIKFSPDYHFLWQSPHSSVQYPLVWDLGLPDLQMDLRVRADVTDQEIPILSPSGDIWEGSCSIAGNERHGRRLCPVDGTAYMELVGYSSPAVELSLTCRLVSAHKRLDRVRPASGGKRTPVP